MDVSYLFARLIGVVLIVAYGSVLFNLNYFKQLWVEIPRQRLILFLSGFVALVFGLVVINLHNVWTFDWRGLITLLGWLITINGAWRMLLPQSALNFTEKMTSSSDTVLYAISGVFFLIGVYLTLVGYFFI